MYELLIVDDVAENLRVLQSILQQADYRIRAATSAKVALKLIDKQLPDLIISDVQMPEMSGIELCQQLGEHKAYQAIPIILVSAFDEAKSVEQVMDSHCQDFLLKPYRPIEVLARVNVQLVRGEQKKHLLRSELSSAVNELVDGVANEINTPLGTSILTSTHMKETIEHFEEQYRTQQVTSGKLKDFISFCHDSVDLNLSNLNRVANMMEMFKDISASDGELDLQDVNLVLVIEKVIAHYHAKLAQSGVVVKLSGDKVYLRTDAHLLQIVFGNLIANSLAHAYGCSDNRNIEIQWQRDGSQLRIQFWDNGDGVEEAHIDEVIKPFYTTKRGRGGHVGLSATVAANIIIGPLKGRFELESDQRGLVWELFLPLNYELLE